MPRSPWHVESMDFEKNRENSFSVQSVLVKILRRRDLPAQFVRFVMDFWVCKLRMNCSPDLSQGYRTLRSPFKNRELAARKRAEVKHCQQRGNRLSISVAKYDLWYGFAHFLITATAPPIEPVSFMSLNPADINTATTYAVCLVSRLQHHVLFRLMRHQASKATYPLSVTYGIAGIGNLR